MSNKTAHIPFVLGGRILDRQYPKVLRPNPKASARRNRTMSQTEWKEFCDEFELAMSWSHNWPHLLFNRSVLITFCLWFGSIVLLVITQRRRRREYYSYGPAEEIDSSNHTHDNPQSKTLVYKGALPDICVLLLLTWIIAMGAALMQMSFRLQDSISKLCDEYTHRYQDFYGIRFEVQRSAAIPTAPWRMHSVRHNREVGRSYILISKMSEDATSCYQNASPQQQFATAKHIYFSKHPQHPNDEMGEPPFFDVARVPQLLPPQAHGAAKTHLLTMNDQCYNCI